MGQEEVRDYLLERLEVLSTSGNVLRLKNCPFCGKHRTLKVNVEYGSFHCYHGDCHEKGGLAKLIAAVEGCGIAEAALQLATLRTPTRSQSLADLETQPEPTSTVESNALPDEFQPCWDGKRFRVPSYLRERGVKKADIKRWNLGFCTEGRYAGRIIIPVRCNGLSSFVARDFTGQALNKYDTPPGNSMDSMLFGYDEVKPGGMVVAVEGTFDAIRLWRLGYQAVGYFGSCPMPAQLVLLESLEPDPLIMLPDGNDPAAQAKVSALTFGLANRFRNVKLGVLHGKDPDGTPKKDLARAIEEAHFVRSEAEQLQFVTEAIRDPWA